MLSCNVLNQAKENHDMGSQNKKDSFIVQAGILAAAGIISRIIGLLYRSPLERIIGDEGNGYYGTAFNFYTIILLVSSYSIPTAISKVISGRLALKEYKNAHRIFHCALIYVVVVGGLASVFAFFGAKFLVRQNAVVVLQVFAPTIFFSGILGVLRGYFQAHKSMVQTSVSQIVEQLLNAVVSIMAAYFLMQTVRDQTETIQAVYGAMGSALGTGISVIVSLLFMYWMYSLNRGMFKKRIEYDRTRKQLSYSHIFKIILMMVTPVILSTFIYNCTTSLNQKIFETIYATIKQVSDKDIATMYGVFSGKAVVLSNIPIAIASAMSVAMIPTVSGAYETGDIRGTNRKIGDAIHVTMLISIPSAVGLFVLAKPVINFLFITKETADLAARLLQCICITIIFYALSTLTNGVLQGIGKVNIPVKNAAIAVIVQTVIIIPLLYFTNLGLYALCIAMIVYSLMMCILNGVAVKRILGYRQKIIRTFIMPFISSIMMGGVVLFTYYGLYQLVKSNTICLFVSVLIGAIIYFIISVLLGVISENDLRKFPKGTLLIKAAKKLHIL